MYKIERRGEGGGSKNRLLGQTRQFSLRMIKIKKFSRLSSVENDSD